MRTRWKIGAVVLLVAVPAALFVFYVLSGAWLHDARNEVPQVPFDAAAWRVGDAWQVIKQTKDSRTVRSKMIEDLLHRYQFKGWSREQVTDLLGQGDDRGDAFHRWDLVYVLGLARGFFALDYEALGFKFDDQERVKEYRVDID